MDYNPSLNNTDRQPMPTPRDTITNTRRQTDQYSSRNKTCMNDAIFKDSTQNIEEQNLSHNHSIGHNQFIGSNRNSNMPNVLSEKKIYQNENNLNDFYEKKTFQFNNKENFIRDGNYDLEVCDEIKDTCQVCSERLIEGEIVYCCLCSRFYHPNCLIYLTNSTCNTGIINKQCDDCLSTYIFGNYELPKKSPLDSTNESNRPVDGSQNDNLSLIDTNINNLENYNEMCGIAFYLSSPESLAEIIHKKNESVCVQQNREIERIALSPIIITTTPYSGKTKKQISSNCKVEDYMRLQNTHTTPNNKQMNMSSVSRVNEVHYEQSPEGSLHGIRQHLSFYSPNNLNNEFYTGNEALNNNTNSGYNMKNLNQALNQNMPQENNNNQMIIIEAHNNTHNFTINDYAVKENKDIIMSSSSRLVTNDAEEKHYNNLSNKIFNSNNFKSKSNNNLNKFSQENKNFNIDIDKFFKSINFVGGNKLSFSDKKNNIVNSSSAYNNTTNTTSINQLSFKKLNFDDIDVEDSFMDREKENENCMDKENSPPLPRENSKFSYMDPEINIKNLPIDINIEAGISHIVSNKGKIVEIPITVDFKFKENFNLTNINSTNSNENLYLNCTKDYIILFNTSNLNIDNIHQILKIIFDKISDGDRIFTNIFKLEKWLVKEDLKHILGIDDTNYKIIFESFLQDTALLNFFEILKLANYLVDLSFEYHSNIFSIILINDVDEIPAEIDCLEEMKIVSEKLKTSKVNLLKNFTINCVLLDNGKIETMGNVKYVSFLNDLSMLCMGYFYAPKDFLELNKSIYTLMSIFEQSCLLNMKVNIKGNKDPSVFIEILNYPHVKKQHNNFDIYLGSLLKKEKKYLNLTAVVILNNQNISMNLPLIEVKLEFLSTKSFKDRESTGISSLNSFYNILNLSGANNLVKNKTPYFQISIPVITLDKDIQISHSVNLRNCCARIGEKLKQSLENFKKFEFEESLNKLYECKSMFGQTIENQTGLMKFLKSFSDYSSYNYSIPNNSSILGNNFYTNNSINYPGQNFSCDDSFNDFVKNLNTANISKIFNFCFLILQDINNLIEIVRNRQVSLICDFFTTNQSLIFYRPVNLTDDRFLEDMIE